MKQFHSRKRLYIYRDSTLQYKSCSYSARNIQKRSLNITKWKHHEIFYFRFFNVCTCTSNVFLCFASSSTYFCFICKVFINERIVNATEHRFKRMVDQLECRSRGGSVLGEHSAQRSSLIGPLVHIDWNSVHPMSPGGRYGYSDERA
jgi:hypothetical protein